MTDNQDKCPTCGSRVRVEGKTTKYFVPLDMKESLRERARAFAIGSLGIFKDDPLSNEQTKRIGYIEEALLQFAQEFSEEQGKAVREATIRQCADIADTYYETLLKEDRSFVQGIEVAETLRNKILSLLPHEPKKEME